METCNLNERVDPKVDPFRTIQIHPTRRCNLACLHCYSSSAPHLKDMLDIEALKRFLAYARENGFNNISVSGGEPFMYAELEELLRFSRSLGYQNTVASNGMLLQSERNKRILEYVDLIALSIDGPQDLHDYIRGPHAYEKMMQGAALLREMDKAFGFIHTVTPQSWDYLLQLADFAFEHGAKLLQLHPLEMYGRAIEALGDWLVDDALAHRTFILANYLQSKYDGKMVVQLDLLHREYLESFPAIVNTFERQCALNGRLSDLFDNIVVEESGRILPVSYGFNPAFAIGNVHDFNERMFERFVAEKTPVLRALYSDTLHKVFENKQFDMVNWNEILVAESKRRA